MVLPNNNGLIRRASKILPTSKVPKIERGSAITRKRILVESKTKTEDKYFVHGFVNNGEYTYTIKEFLPRKITPSFNRCGI